MHPCEIRWGCACALNRDKTPGGTQQGVSEETQAIRSRAGPARAAQAYLLETLGLDSSHTFLEWSSHFKL